MTEILPYYLPTFSLIYNFFRVDFELLDIKRVIFIKYLTKYHDYIKGAYEKK